MGCEVDPTNLAQTAEGLKLEYDLWNSASPKPQAAKYKAWMKGGLVRWQQRGRATCTYTCTGG